MDVRCPQCDTLYEIDAPQLRGGAATLKCSQCDHVFRLETNAALSQENQRRWMVQNTSSGDVLYCSAFDELHGWILQGKVGKDDQISRTGKKWKQLGNIGEFMPIFQAVESISNISASRAAQKRRAEGSAPDRAPAPSPTKSAESSSPSPSSSSEPQFRSKVQTSQQFVVRDEPEPKRRGRAGLSEASSPEPKHTPVEAQRSQTPTHQRPSGGVSEEKSAPQVKLQSGAFGGVDDADGSDDQWSFGDGSSLAEVEASGQFDSVGYDEPRSRWPVMLVVVVLLIGGAGAGVWFLRPDLVDQWLAVADDEEVVNISKQQEEQDDPAEDEEASVSPEELLAAATDNALEAVRRANADKLAESAAAASPKVALAVARAEEQAKEAAEEPDADEILSRANRYLERGSPSHARRKFHEVLEIESRNVSAITGLGWSLLALGSPAAASAQFKKALAIDSRHGDAYIGLGKAEREQGNTAAALEAYRDYLDRFPGGPKSSIAGYQAKQLEKALE